MIRCASLYKMVRNRQFLNSTLNLEPWIRKKFTKNSNDYLAKYTNAWHQLMLDAPHSRPAICNNLELRRKKRGLWSFLVEPFRATNTKSQGRGSVWWAALAGQWRLQITTGNTPSSRWWLLLWGYFGKRGCHPGGRGTDPDNHLCYRLRPLIHHKKYTLCVSLGTKRVVMSNDWGQASPFTNNDPP